jgi:hypothetical protein
MCDITDEEFENLYLPFYNNFTDYMTNYIIPDVVAFYLANNYSRNCLCNSPLYNHINSAIDVFNIQCNINKLIPQIKKILKIKYNLKIINNNPLKLNKFM